MPDVTDIEEIPRTYDDAVRTLVRWHGEGGPADLRVFLFPDPDEQVVRLLEVSDEFFTASEIHPLTLGRSAIFPFRSATALARPEDWDQVQAGRLSLPQGWNLNARRQVWP